MTTSRRSALKALLAAPAAGVLAGQAQAATTQAGPPQAGPAGAPVFPAPNTAPSIHLAGEAPPPWPTWEGPVPTDWIDPKTGHRIVRLSGDEGGSKLYFYRNSF
ncbi:MAG: hypothetical protein VXZ00_07630, partial [Pseudomonadota bacterium]|nr:hypothetical protein [Pseudomonadota bacterium]